MGAAGKHLSPEDPAVISILKTMVQALSTPSEAVQKSVFECLVQLVQLSKNCHADKANEMLFQGAGVLRGLVRVGLVIKAWKFTGKKSFKYVMIEF